MIDDDDAFILEAVRGDALAFEAADRMPMRKLLAVLVSYLRRVSFEVRAAKAAARKHG